MISTLNRTLGKKVVRDSGFLHCVWFSYRCKHYGHFGFRRGSPRWAHRAVKFLQFFKIYWRCTTLEDHISRSGWPIWAKVCLLERSNSLLLRKNIKIGIYCLPPILGQKQCLIAYNSQRPSSSDAGLWGLSPPTIVLYKTFLRNLGTMKHFEKKIFFSFLTV